MAVQVGQTFFFRRNLILEYDCSACGEHNRQTATISESVFTSALVRADPYKEAESSFEHKVKWLNKGPVPDRYEDSGLSCSCAKCGHYEPWTHFYKKSIKPALFWAPLIVTTLVAIAAPIPAGIPKFLCLLSGLIPGCCVAVKNAMDKKKKLNAIKALPAKSLPVVTLEYQSRNFR